MAHSTDNGIDRQYFITGYARLAPVYFPAGPNDRNVVLHQVTAYRKSAMWDRVKAWFDGGDAPDNWTKDMDYLEPPKVGTLAEIDPALIVTPPEGLETGYVPIVTGQRLKP